MVIEVYRKNINQFGTVEKAIAEGYFIDWTVDRIREAFNNGNGTERDLKRYMDNNSHLCRFITI